MFVQGETVHVSNSWHPARLVHRFRADVADVCFCVLWYAYVILNIINLNTCIAISNCNSKNGHIL